MHVAVLGAGVTGVVTAYYLSRQGHRVTVFERDEEVGSGTSFANAGQLAYSYVDSMANPSFAARIPRILLGQDPTSRFRFGAGIRFAGWGFRFLSQCTPSRSRANTLALLKPAMQSSENLSLLRNETGLEFDFHSLGKLVLLRTQDEIAKARRSAELKREHGCETQILSIDEVVELEPAVEHMNGDYRGAIFAQGDHVGDAAKFTRALADWLTNKGKIELRKQSRVQKVVVNNGQAVALRTDAEEISTDAVCACLGVWSDELLGPLGIRTGICPIRGYSLTLPCGEATPGLSVTDPEQRFVVTRMGDNVRVAGFADFLGFDTSRDRERTDRLLAIAQSTAPRAADFSADEKNRWGGFRPMTADGRPLVGATKIGGLYLNTGHGALGWTLACATGERIAEIISDGRSHA